MPASITFVDDAAALAPALDDVTDDVLGVDVERADSDRYHRRAALVQVGDAGACVLLDPLAIPDPTPLRPLFRERLVVLHALENDVEPLEALGLELPNVADTGVAAAMLGMPTGLTNLLEEVLGVELDTDKDRYQRADWEKRPLSQGMVDYAAGDVLHLPALWRAMQQRLDEAGRWDWYEQELQATIELARTDTRDWTRTKGVGRLDPRGRAVLRALWEERERICVTQDVAPNRLIHDKVLLALAEEPVDDVGELLRRGQRRKGPLKDHAEELYGALRRGLEAEPEEKDDARRMTEEDRAAFDALRRRRSRTARQVGLDAGVLCPGRMLRDAVAASPSDPETFAAAAGLRPWQQELLLEDLWSTYRSTLEEAAG